MQISIRLSAALAQSSGKTRLSLSLPEAATVNDAIVTIAQQMPELQSKLQLVIPFVAGQQMERSAPLQHGQELALLLPAAGGLGDRKLGNAEGGMQNRLPAATRNSQTAIRN